MAEAVAAFTAAAVAAVAAAAASAAIAAAQAMTIVAVARTANIFGKYVEKTFVTANNPWHNRNCIHAATFFCVTGRHHYIQL